MQKSFFSLNRFSALCICASFSLLACSEDKPPPNHQELCESGATVECLAGTWALLQIENAASGSVISGSDASGTLILSKEGSYEFEYSSKVGPFSHYGSWSLAENGESITVECSTGECTPSRFPGEKRIELSNSGSILKIQRAPFSNYVDPDLLQPIANPVEKYQFRP